MVFCHSLENRIKNITSACEHKCQISFLDLKQWVIYMHYYLNFENDLYTCATICTGFQFDTHFKGKALIIIIIIIIIVSNYIYGHCFKVTWIWYFCKIALRLNEIIQKYTGTSKKYRSWSIYAFLSVLTLGQSTCSMFWRL